MKKANLIEANKRSFLQISSSEIDDYQDDDEESTNNKPKKVYKKSQSNTDEEELTFLQKKAENRVSEALNNDKNFVYNQPKENRSDLDMQRAQIFRNTQMANLQGVHTYKQASRENINEAFNRGSASLGKSNADEFVSFLGYLRDASSKASQLIARREEKKLAKLMKGSDDPKKDTLKAPEGGN